MKLEDITRIKMTTREDEVNSLLAQGYRITKILSTKIVVGDRESVLPTFILGLIKDGSD